MSDQFDDGESSDGPISLGEMARIAMDSFVRTDGATVNLYLGDLQGQRLFAVAVKGRGRRLPQRLITTSRIERYIEDQIDLLNNKQYSLGIWYDAEEAVTWLDVSQTVPDEHTARQLAAERGEKAIYALEDGREIDLSGSE